MNNGQKAKRGSALMKYIKARNKKNGLQMTGTTTAKKHKVPTKSAIGSKIMK